MTSRTRRAAAVPWTRRVARRRRPGHGASHRRVATLEPPASPATDHGRLARPRRPDTDRTAWLRRSSRRAGDGATIACRRALSRAVHRSIAPSACTATPGAPARRRPHAHRGDSRRRRHARRLRDQRLGPRPRARPRRRPRDRRAARSIVNNRIHDALHGVYVRQADGARIEGNTIVGTRDRRAADRSAGARGTPAEGELCEVDLNQNRRGNGVHIWNSSGHVVAEEHDSPHQGRRVLLVRRSHRGA